MQSQINLQNTLADEVEKNGWFRRKRLSFKNISFNDIEDFPEMTEQHLKILFTGSFQFKQGISYLAEIMNGSGLLNLPCVKVKINILKALCTITPYWK